MPKLLRRHTNHFTFPLSNSKEHVFRFTAELKEADRLTDVFVTRTAWPENTHQFAMRPISGPTDLLIWVIRQHSCVMPIMEDKAYLWLLKLTRFSGKMSSFDKMLSRTLTRRKKENFYLGF
jgi:hypothetical protein